MADSLSALGARIYRGIRLARPQLPEPTQLVLLGPIGNASTAWALSLLLAAWRITDPATANKWGDAAATEAVVSEAGALPLLRAIQTLKASLPVSFTSFVDTAAAATTETDFVGAASYFQSAVKDLGGTVRSALHGWLSSPQFKTGGAGLTARFPEPGGPMLPQQQEETFTAKPKTFAEDKQAQRARFQSRAKHFDHMGRPAVVGAAMVPITVEEEITYEPPKPSPPAPSAKEFKPAPPASREREVKPLAIGRRDLTKAFLVSRGWKEHEVDRFLAGPEKSHHTAEVPFRKFRALPKAERATLIRELDKKGLWRGLDEKAGSVVDVTEESLVARKGYSSSVDAYKELRSLPEKEQTRFLKLVRRFELEVPVPPNGDQV